MIYADFEYILKVIERKIEKILLRTNIKNMLLL